MSFRLFKVFLPCGESFHKKTDWGKCLGFMIVILGFFCPVFTQAHHPPGVALSASANGLTLNPIEKNQVVIEYFSACQFYEIPAISAIATDMRSGDEKMYLMHFVQQNLAVQYGVTRRLSVQTMLPVASVHSRQFIIPYVHLHDSQKWKHSLVDIPLLCSYWISTKQEKWAFGFQLGAEAPLSKSNAEQFGNGLLLNSGTWDVLAGLTIIRRSRLGLWQSQLRLNAPLAAKSHWLKPGNWFSAALRWSKTIWHSGQSEPKSSISVSASAQWQQQSPAYLNATNEALSGSSYKRLNGQSALHFQRPAWLASIVFETPLLQAAHPLGNELQMGFYFQWQYRFFIK